MRVLGIYGKDDLDVLTCEGRIVSEIMNKFFKKFPQMYRKNYDNNLKTLEIWKIDEHYEGNPGGEYYETHNLLIFRKHTALIHELMHMSSYDSFNKKIAFVKLRDGILFETALLEGMTEYLSSIALNRESTDYFFETFAVSMLSNIDGIFEPYFIPSYDNFIKLFPNKKDIISLMYSLNYYSNKSEQFLTSYNGNSSDDDVSITRIEHSINDVIDSLIDIQLSMKMGSRKDKIYGEKFMDLIGSESLIHYLGDFHEDYIDYANEQINKRILRRI